MLSGAITAAITALLGLLGVTPSATLVGGIFVAVKISVMSVIALIGWRALKKKQRAGLIAPPIDRPALDAAVPPAPPSEPAAEPPAR